MEGIYAVLKACVDPVCALLLLLLLIFLSVIRSDRKSAAVFLFVVCIFVYAASIPFVADELAYGLEKDYIDEPSGAGEPFDLIVVLGGGTYDLGDRNETRLSPFSTTRLAHAVEQYHRKPSRYFVCSGMGSAAVSEARQMAELALIFGVPKEKLRIEGKSKTTWENALEVNQLFTYKSVSVGLVTSAWHMNRALNEFRKYFPHVMPVPSDFLRSPKSATVATRFVPQAAALHQTTIVLQERIGQIWYIIRNL